MSSQTTNLNLIKPDIDDSVEQTIQDLASNFQKLDDASDVFVNSTPEDGKTYAFNTRRWNAQPTIGNYAGWINLRAGVAVPFQKRMQLYAVGDKVKDSSNNGHYYTCTVAGKTGVFEPDFPLATNGTVRDIKFATMWSKNTFYTVQDMVLPTIENNCWYECIQTGNADPNFQPNWPTSEGEEVTDGATKWKCHRIVTWKESGTSANFRPFGKIE